MRVGKLGGIAAASDAITADMAEIRTDVRDASENLRRAAAIAGIAFALVALGVIVALVRTGGHR